MKSLVGLALGSSLISVFARLGGGIYTKAADVGADLVGKIESNLDEDDPRNPATIADNVGDNVGDCAGMAADVFETYAVSLVGAILVGRANARPPIRAAIIYPFVLGGISVLGAIIGILFVNISGGKPATVLMGAVGASGLVSAILFWPATHMLFPNDVIDRRGRALGERSLLRFARGPGYDGRRRHDHELLHFDGLSRRSGKSRRLPKPATPRISSRASPSASTPPRCP